MRSRGLWLCAAVMAVVVPRVGAQTFTITTSDGDGADAYISTSRSGPHGAEPELYVAADPDLEASAKVYLRFDLWALRGRPVAQATLILQPLAGDPAPQDINVIGLRDVKPDGTIPTGELWRERPTGDMETKPVAITSKNAPANSAADIGGYRTDPRQRPPGVQSSGEMLGVMTVRGDQSQPLRFTGPQLVRFLNADVNGLATIVLTRASRNPVASGFASREHPLLPGPRLVVTLAPEPIERAVERLLRFPVSRAGKRETLGDRWSLIQRTAMASSWAKALPMVNELVEAVDADRRLATGVWAGSGRDLLAERPTNQLAVARRLLTLLRADAMLAAGEIDQREWLPAWRRALDACPQRSDELVHAARFLNAGFWRSSGAVASWRERALLGADLPAPARRAVLEMIEAREAPPRSADPAVRARYYRTKLLAPLQAIVPDCSHEALLGQRLEIEGVMGTLESHWLRVQVAAGGTSWRDVLPRVEALARGVWAIPEKAADTAAPPRPVGALASLLRAEARLAGGAMTEAQNLATFEAILGQHPAAADQLLIALEVLLPEASLPADGATLPRYHRLLYADLPAAARAWVEGRARPLTVAREALASPVPLDAATGGLEAYVMRHVLLGPADQRLVILDRLLGSFAPPAPAQPLRSVEDRRQSVALTALKLLRLDLAAVDGSIPHDVYLAQARELLAGAALPADALAAAMILRGSDADVPCFAPLLEPGVADSLPAPARRLLSPVGDPSPRPVTAADPLWLDRYVALLDQTGDEAGALTLLDELAAAFADAPLGVTAALLRIQRSAVGTPRDDAIINLSDTRPGTLLAQTLRPACLAARARRGQVEIGLTAVDGRGDIAAARSARQFALAVTGLLGELAAPVDLSPIVPRDRDDLRALVGPVEPLPLTALLAQRCLRDGDHLTASHLCLAALERFAQPPDETRPAPPAASSDPDAPLRSAALLARVQVAAGDLPAARITLAPFAADDSPLVAPLAQLWSPPAAAEQPTLAALDAAFRQQLARAASAADRDEHFIAAMHAATLARRLGYLEQAAALIDAVDGPGAAAPYVQLALGQKVLIGELSDDADDLKAAGALRLRLAGQYLAQPIRPLAPLAFADELAAARAEPDDKRAVLLAAHAAGRCASTRLWREAMPAYELIAARAPASPLAQQALAQVLLDDEASGDERRLAHAAACRRLLVENDMDKPIAAVHADAPPQP